MIQLYDANIEECLVHFVGNKTNDEGLKLSKEPLSISNETRNALNNYFYKPFVVREDYFSFFHQTNVNLNTIYSYIKEMFSNKGCFYEQSLNIARYLYEKSTHPKIKGGELYVAYINNCIIDGKYVNAIGLFKSESKDTFLMLHQNNESFEISSQNGVSINKLDKGCLILNVEEEDGYIVAVVDNTNKGTEAKYWTDDFLHVRPRKDSFNQTQNMLSLCKSFVSKLSCDNGKIEKVAYMNRSVEALKEGSVNINTFAEQVFETPNLISEFKQYKENYQKERDIEIDDSFETVSNAIKRRATGSMTTIKLDKNFDINIHGGEQYIVRGYDEERGMYYYQLFFREEK